MIALGFTEPEGTYVLASDFPHNILILWIRMVGVTGPKSVYLGFDFVVFFVFNPSPEFG